MSFANILRAYGFQSSNAPSQVATAPILPISRPDQEALSQRSTSSSSSSSSAGVRSPTLSDSSTASYSTSSSGSIGVGLRKRKRLPKKRRTQPPEPAFTRSTVEPFNEFDHEQLRNLANTFESASREMLFRLVVALVDNQVRPSSDLACRYADCDCA